MTFFAVCGSSVPLSWAPTWHGERLFSYFWPHDIFHLENTGNWWHLSFPEKDRVYCWLEPWSPMVEASPISYDPRQLDSKELLSAGIWSGGLSECNPRKAWSRKPGKYRSMLNRLVTWKAELAENRYSLSKGRSKVCLLRLLSDWLESKAAWEGNIGNPGGALDEYVLWDISCRSCRL